MAVETDQLLLTAHEEVARDGIGLVLHLRSLLARLERRRGVLDHLRVERLRHFVAALDGAVVAVFAGVGLLTSLLLPKNAARIESEGYEPPKDEEPAVTA